MKEAFSSEYERCDLRANSTKKGVMQVANTQLLRTFVRGGSVLAVFASNTKVSSQCLTLGSSFSYNLVKNVCFSIRQLFLCLSAQCAHLQSNFWIPVSGHWNDTLLVAQCSYSCVSVTFMTSGEL
ncbi:MULTISPECIES: hypothetical protein [unclassified Wolbachia]|uniref:hypothetical protein n=1 Tax=unclassified Wolbachia TaxID=2640676 RepID=UPI000AC51216|nr:MULTISPECIES: hypothetical protein [unclassified Wolbachia]